MSRPWLSVLIPTYNGELFLPAALNSILAQGDNSIECIVIDDGSTDTTLEIINSYKEKLHLKSILQKRQGNWVSNTNYALSLASGEYICFLHQDDIWLPGRISHMKKLVENFPYAELFLHPSNFINDRGRFLGQWRCPLTHESTSSNKMLERLLVQNFISIPAPIFKLKTAIEVGGMEPTLWYTADWDFWLKLAACGDTIYCPRPFSCFRIHSTSQTARRSAYQQEFRKQLETVSEKHLELWNVPVPLKKNVADAAKFSNEINIALAGVYHEQGINPLQLVGEFIALGPNGWHRYLRDSRIWERTSARIKARLISK